MASESGTHVIMPRHGSLFEEAQHLLSRLMLEAKKQAIPLAELTELISLLAIASSTAKASLNLYNPANQLPNEVLALIFGYIPTLTRGTTWLGHSPDVHTADLLPLTHVCQRWRTVALSTPLLWTTILATPTDQNAAFLLRTGSSAKLACHLHTMGRGGEFSLSLLEDHHHRIRTLHVDFVSGSSPVLYALLRLPMPQLEEASVCPELTDNPFPVTRLSKSGRFLLFDGHAPQLRNLVLHGVQGLPENRFNLLTFLSLSVPHRTTNLHDLVDFLSHCPRLEHLVLGALHFHPASLRDPVQPVALPNLRSLMFLKTQSLREVDILLSNIFPARTYAVAIDTVHVVGTATVDVLVFPSRAPTRVYFKAQDQSANRMEVVAANENFAISISTIPISSREDVLQSELACYAGPLAGVKELWLRTRCSFGCDWMLKLLNVYTSISSLVLRIDADDDCYAGDSSWEWSSHVLEMKQTAAAILPICARVTYLRLCLDCSSIPPSVRDGLVARAQTGDRLARLVVEIPQNRAPCFEASELEPFADVVEVIRTSSCSWMEVPDVYRDRPHHYWPDWSAESQWDPAISQD